MTTKTKVILATSVMLAYCLGVRALIPILRRPNIYVVPPRHTMSAYANEATEESPAVSLKGQYKIDEQKGFCPGCQKENMDVVKPFECDHTICEDCLENMGKANATGNVTTTNSVFFGEIPVIYPVHLVCPQCRAELKQPAQ